MILKPDRIRTMKQTATKSAKKKTAAKRAPRKTSPEAEQKKLWKRELRDLETTQRRTVRETEKAIKKLDRERSRLQSALDRDTVSRRNRIATLKGRLGL
mgnify:CR=1 FL=1